MTHAYPGRLAEFARARWRELAASSNPGPCDPQGAVLPEPEAFEQLLSIAYQASLLQEEERPVRFRLLVGDPARLPLGVGPPAGLHCLRFAQSRPSIPQIRQQLVREPGIRLHDRQHL